MKEKLAQKMLEEKLDFLPLQDSFKLKESGVHLETRFGWVLNIEEMPEGISEKPLDEILEIVKDLYGDYYDNYLTIGDSYSAFDEFTLELCPAPTYIDLIR